MRRAVFFAGFLASAKTLTSSGLVILALTSSFSLLARSNKSALVMASSPSFSRWSETLRLEDFLAEETFAAAFCG